MRQEFRPILRKGNGSFALFSHFKDTLIAVIEKLGNLDHVVPAYRRGRPQQPANLWQSCRNPSGLFVKGRDVPLKRKIDQR